MAATAGEDDVIFVSHDFDDLVPFQNVTDALEAAAVAYFAPDSMRTGVDLSAELRNAVRSCQACIFIATRRSVRSQWCLAELGAFWGAGKPVLIFHADDQLDGGDLPPYLHRDLFERRIRKVVDSVKAILAEKRAGPPLREQVLGYWWESITQQGLPSPSFVSFMQITPDPDTQSVFLKGTAYFPDASVKGWWRSVGSCLSPTSSEVFYYWQGEERGPPNEHFAGFGVISFLATPAGVNSGAGFFWRSRLIDCDASPSTRQRVELERAAPREVEIMASAGRGAIRGLLLEKLGALP